MSKLFMKVGQRPHSWVLAWRDSDAGAISLGPKPVSLSEGEATEFTQLLRKRQHKAMGVGGKNEYRVYDLVSLIGKYAIVWPDVQAVRERYPNACRVVNIQTGSESALCDNLAHATDIANAGVSGKLKGSFI